MWVEQAKRMLAYTASLSLKKKNINKGMAFLSPKRRLFHLWIFTVYHNSCESNDAIPGCLYIQYLVGSSHIFAFLCDCNASPKKKCFLDYYIYTIYMYVWLGAKVFVVLLFELWIYIFLSWKELAMRESDFVFLPFIC